MSILSVPFYYMMNSSSTYILTHLYFIVKITITLLLTLIYFDIINVGTFNSWVEPNFKLKGGDEMGKKDFLISSLVIIIFLLLFLLFIVLI